MNFVLAALAVYRVSRMIALERGPFSVFENMRGWAFERFGKDSWIVEGVGCPLCLSFWVALVAACFLSCNSIVEFVFTWLALSGIASFLIKIER